MKEDVYNKYPLPQPGNVNTQQVTRRVATGVTVATVLYVGYKITVAAITWECGGCGLLITP